MEKGRNRSKEKSRDGLIRSVFADNFIEEIKSLSTYLTKYNYIGMDTEFPGVVFNTTQNSREAYYRNIKANVDKLKLIQVGITISDEWGNYPPDVTTWQFNLKFDLNSDQFSNESIALLTNSGINFELLESRGIPQDVFGEYLITSGLVLNDDIHWISFHGIYDFAYFLRSVTNLPLPETELGFFENLKIYFANFYDIRFLVRYNDNFRGSLAKLGQELNVARIGTQHQAGSDSLITSEIFFKLKKEYLSDESTRNDKNVLFGIGQGNEDNENNYNNYYNNTAYNNKTTNSSNSTFGFDYSNFYQQHNMMNMQYNYMRGGQNNYYSMNNVNIPVTTLGGGLNTLGGLNNINNLGPMNSMNNLNNINSYFTPYNVNGYNQMGVPYMNNGSNSNTGINSSTVNLSDKTREKYNLKED
jgi:CCR4-NOT transcription complex subunit 7/8